MAKRIETRNEMLRGYRKATPPAGDAIGFAADYDSPQMGLSPEDQRLTQSKLYTRGYDWETIPENIQKLHALQNYSLQHPVRLHTLGGADESDFENVQDSIENWDQHWDAQPAGWHGVRASPYTHHSINLHPMGSASETNNTLWHELQHAYQSEEGRFNHDIQNQREIDDPEYMTQPHEVDAEEMSNHMRRYPLIRRVEPRLNPYWFGNEFHSSYGDWDDESKTFKASTDLMHHAVERWREDRTF